MLDQTPSQNVMEAVDRPVEKPGIGETLFVEDSEDPVRHRSARRSRHGRPGVLGRDLEERNSGSC
jgi:hypothetical protein